MSDTNPKHTREGWDRPSGTWHWYSGSYPVCGSDAGLSHIDDRLPVVPAKSQNWVCKRCHKARALLSLRDGEAK